MIDEKPRIVSIIMQDSAPQSKPMTDDDDELDALEGVDGVEGDDGGGLYEHFRFVADKGQQLLRVDKFLVARIEKSSRNRIQQAADAGCILVNGKPVKSNYRVKPLSIRA